MDLDDAGRTDGPDDMRALGQRTGPFPTKNEGAPAHQTDSISLAPVFTPHGRLTVIPADEG